ncbi:MAG: type II toxin-antitoxin system HicA family toxin [Deinococcota bacterium]|nr:type II toxin-antitoxin system HicA family toxin [Deinococcota bacterium]
MKVKEVVKLIKADGWYLARHGKGDHKVYKHPAKPGIIVIDGKLSDDMPKGTRKQVLKAAGLE